MADSNVPRRRLLAWLAAPFVPAPAMAMGFGSPKRQPRTIFLSGERQPLILGAGDRRFAVITVAQARADEAFNDWRSKKLCVVGDEVAGRADLVANRVRLKRLILEGAAPIGRSRGVS